jgi:hypothetical protein
MMATPFLDSDSDGSESPTIQYQPVPIVRRASIHRAILDEASDSDDDAGDSEHDDDRDNEDEDEDGTYEEASVALPAASADSKKPVSPVSETSESSAVCLVATSDEGGMACDPKPTARPTIYEILTAESVDWCRYCGTTEGVNWRPGPWGKRTLCNKHGCDFKGYGFACKLPRLNLTGFSHESIHDRDRPVLQLFCSVCQDMRSYVDNVLVRCDGCPKAYHQKCCPHGGISDKVAHSAEPWFCTAECTDNVHKRRIVVELPRKRLPLMSTPKNGSAVDTPNPSRSSSPALPPPADGGRKSPARKPLTRTSSRRSPSRTKPAAVDRIHTLTPPVDLEERSDRRAEKSPRRRPRTKKSLLAAAVEDAFPMVSTPISTVSSDEG